MGRSFENLVGVIFQFYAGFVIFFICADIGATGQEQMRLSDIARNRSFSRLGYTSWLWKERITQGQGTKSAMGQEHVDLPVRLALLRHYFAEPQTTRSPAAGC